MLRVTDLTAAERPWQVELGDRVFTARLVSQQQLFTYQALIVNAGEARAAIASPERAALTEARMALFAQRWLLRQAFPWRPWMLWQGDPVAHIQRLSPSTYLRVLEDFFASLARDHAPGPDPTAAMPGAPSSGS